MLDKLRNNMQNNKSKCNKFEQLSRYYVQNSFTDSTEIDLESWMESKISGKSFEEIVRAKYLAENA
jgi:hypothetical protein